MEIWAPSASSAVRRGVVYVVGSNISSFSWRTAERVTEMVAFARWAGVRRREFLVEVGIEPRRRVKKYMFLGTGC